VADLLWLLFSRRPTSLQRIPIVLSYEQNLQGISDSAAGEEMEQAPFKHGDRSVPWAEGLPGR